MATTPINSAIVSPVGLVGLKHRSSIAGTLRWTNGYFAGYLRQAKMK